MSNPLNHTFITLIPKRDNPNFVDHFRPISLCNVLYKFITKILSNCLNPLLDRIVSPFQSAFIPGRTMIDIVICSHEIMHDINQNRDKPCLIAIKIDIVKAYEKVEWGVLETILTLHGFPIKFIYLILQCISTASFSILVNGSSFGLFQSSRGIL